MPELVLLCPPELELVLVWPPELVLVCPPEVELVLLCPPELDEVEPPHLMCPHEQVWRCLPPP